MSKIPVLRVPMTGDSVGGVWAFTLDLARALQPWNIEVMFVAMGGRLNWTPRAVRNIWRESMAFYGYSPVTRVFEAAGAGACLITDSLEDVEQFFAPGVEVLVARDGEEIVGNLTELTPDRAPAIAQAALRRARGEHTYTKRATLREQVREGKSAAGVTS